MRRQETNSIILLKKETNSIKRDQSSMPQNNSMTQADTMQLLHPAYEPSNIPIPLK